MVHRRANYAVAPLLIGLVALLGAAPSAVHSSLSVLPADGQTVKLRLTGDRQTIDGDSSFNTELTLVRTGHNLAVTSAPASGSPLGGDARILEDGSLLIAPGDLAVQLDAVNLASAVASAAPVPLSLVSTWNASVPVATDTSVTVPISVIVSDPAPAHTALSAQGRGSVPIQSHSGGPVLGNVSVQYTLNFKNGAFAGAAGVIFADAGPTSKTHTVTNWHLAPEN
jgi:hypothetical protein